MTSLWNLNSVNVWIYFCEIKKYGGRNKKKSKQGILH